MPTSQPRLYLATNADAAEQTLTQINVVLLAAPQYTLPRDRRPPCLGREADGGGADADDETCEDAAPRAARTGPRSRIPRRQPRARLRLHCSARRQWPHRS